MFVLAAGCESLGSLGTDLPWNSGNERVKYWYMRGNSSEGSILRE